jgi:hypothetical protein
MPDPQPLTRRQIARAEKLASANHVSPATRESPPGEHRGGRGASRAQPKRSRVRTAGIQMVQSYLQVHD